jgi:hypothetical protein
MIDWTIMYKKYKGLWVALDLDEKTVLASGRTAKQALSRARKEGHENPILNYVPRELSVF